HFVFQPLSVSGTLSRPIPDIRQEIKFMERGITPMNSMKKIMALLLVLVFMVGVFAGCSSNS
ncbi:MAG: hypothetical protein LJU34_06495, partial [Oscillospiraceae bacterium]|nr:hypothetical protein [Oscillospiraceae bacterium]